MQPYPPFQPLFKDVDGEHFILAEGGVVPLFLLGQGALVGLVPVLSPLEVLCLLLKASLDDVGLVHKSSTEVMYAILGRKEQRLYKRIISAKFLYSASVSVVRSSLDFPINLC